MHFARIVIILNYILSIVCLKGRENGLVVIKPLSSRVVSKYTCIQISYIVLV